MQISTEESEYNYQEEMLLDLGELCDMGCISLCLHYDLRREINAALELIADAWNTKSPLPQHFVECAVRLNKLLVALENHGKSDAEVALICKTSSGLSKLITHLGEICFTRHCSDPASWKISSFSRLK